MALANADEPLSFEKDVKPLFRERDRQSMSSRFDLGSYDDVVANSGRILARLQAGTMPCDGAWPPKQVDVFKRWVDSGTPA
jgi:hypothetical protein